MQSIRSRLIVKNEVLAIDHIRLLSFPSPVRIRIPPLRSLYKPSSPCALFVFNTHTAFLVSTTLVVQTDLMAAPKTQWFSSLISSTGSFFFFAGEGEARGGFGRKDKEEENRDESNESGLAPPNDELQPQRRAARLAVELDGLNSFETIVLH
ncbi:hypothetical protein OPV22_030560 [Ensete ventricosum]|uniref:Uncharacterized protein n=1 Tax=Ensete ventricosum TaxID=4639 RepID=A0AAV8Q4G7_ENSVE|nr:hypothetical protein OPV22_030560 [Ensete ventricosum]RWW07253.1 hypothetical protein GW17_00029376 [Ensete ventricosum]RWW50437.1 hypothetical protein BHE74_00043307 [Ensete ventricosum]RZS17990.1 hypothetical protein BHM03_00050202 [Ensete ventricosum]